MAYFEMAVAIMISTIIYFLYKASVELNDRHWQLKMGMFYAAIGVGWAALNVALRMAVDASASGNMQTAITIVYRAYTTVSVVAVIYVGIRFFAFVLNKFLEVAKFVSGKKKVEIEEQAW